MKWRKWGRERGLEALQAVLLIGVTIGILLGLIAMWRNSIEPAVRTGVANIVNPQYAQGPGGGQSGTEARPGNDDHRPLPHPYPGVGDQNHVQTPRQPGEVIQKPTPPLINDHGIVGAIGAGATEGAKQVNLIDDAHADAIKQTAIETAQQRIDAANKDIARGIEQHGQGRVFIDKATEVGENPGAQRMGQVGDILQKEASDNIQRGVTDLPKAQADLADAHRLPGAAGRTVSNWEKGLGKAGSVLGVAGTAIQVANGINEILIAEQNGDGRGVVVAGSSTVGSITGGWGGAYGGAIAGGALGGPPGAIIGAILGSIAGENVGSAVGGGIGNVFSDEIGLPPSRPTVDPASGQVEPVYILFPWLF